MSADGYYSQMAALAAAKAEAPGPRLRLYISCRCVAWGCLTARGAGC